MDATLGRYRKLKDKLPDKYRGIDISQVLAVYLWVWAEAKAIEGVEENETEQALDLSFLQGIDKSKIIYFDIDRKDHQSTFNGICSSLNDDYKVIDIAFNVKYKQHRTVVNKWLSRFYVRASQRQCQLTKREREQVSYRVCLVLNTIDELYAMKKQLSHVTHFVSYSAIHPWGNMLCQFFRLQHAKVFGLSHAVHYIYTDNVPIHCLNYENLDVDYSLVWGQYTKDEYLRYGVKAKEILVAGYPKKIEVQQTKNANELKSCLVLLSNPDYDATNRKLLTMLSVLANLFTYSLKLHPSCNYEYYSHWAARVGMYIIGKDVQLTECFDKEKYDFAIAVNTTSYYEIMAAGIPCLRYRDDEAYQMTYGAEEDMFATAEEFARALEWLRGGIEGGTYDDVARHTLHYAMGIGENKYREILSTDER